jgi:uncharacterized protein
MSTFENSKLRFNFGFLLEAPFGSSREIEVNYPHVKFDDDVELTPLTGTFKASRNTQGVYIEGTLYSIAATDCDRCLEPYDAEIAMQLDEMYFYPASTAPAGAYVIKANGQLDLAPLVRDLAVLSIPIQLVCRPDCSGLCVECGQNLNEKDCGCDPQLIDPRLAALKKLLDQE